MSCGSAVTEVPGVRCQERETRKLKRVGAKRKSRLKRSGSGETPIRADYFFKLL